MRFSAYCELFVLGSPLRDPSGEPWKSCSSISVGQHRDVWALGGGGTVSHCADYSHLPSVYTYLAGDNASIAQTPWAMPLVKLMGQMGL